jgi:hypothetical protein
MFLRKELATVRPKLIEVRFEDDCCSLGNDRNYYVRLMKMPEAARNAILVGPFEK